jgi:chromosome segregation ATPase
MLECINKDCKRNDNKKCLDKIDFCNMRITHSPTYAAEQLENAKEKEKICYNFECTDNDLTGLCTRKSNTLCQDKIKEPPVMNYEAEYKKLKAENETLEASYEIIKVCNEHFKRENEELKKQVAALDQELKDNNSINEELEKTLDKYRNENTEYRLNLANEKTENIKQEIENKLLESISIKDKLIEEKFKENAKLKEVIKKLSELI